LLRGSTRPEAPRTLTEAHTRRGEAL
jgi:hypothetical protein